MVQAAKVQSSPGLARDRGSGAAQLGRGNALPCAEHHGAESLLQQRRLPAACATAAASRSSRLTRLVLRYNKLESLHWLDAAAVPLRVLDLRRNRVEGLASLAPLAHMTALTDLSLRGLNGADPNPVCGGGGHVPALLRLLGPGLRVLDGAPVSALTPCFDGVEARFRSRNGAAGGTQQRGRHGDGDATEEQRSGGGAGGGGVGVGVGGGGGGDMTARVAQWQW